MVPSQLFLRTQEKKVLESAQSQNVDTNESKRIEKCVRYSSQCWLY